MSGTEHARVFPDWHHLLGRHLMAQASVSAQWSLMVDTIAQLVDADVELWLDTPLRRPPFMSELHGLASDAPSELMRSSTDAKVALSGAAQTSSSGLEAAVPLLALDKTLGALQVTRRGGTPFAAEDIERLAHLAPHVVAALQSLYQSAADRWHDEQLSLIQKIGLEVASVPEAEQSLPRVATLIGQAFPFGRVALFLLDAAGKVLSLCAKAGPSANTEPAVGLVIPLGKGIVGRVGETGQEVVATNITCESRRLDLGALPETRSAAAFPLKIQDRLLGVLEVQSGHLQDFFESDLTTLRTVAGHIAVALDSSQLQRSLARRARQISFLAQVTRAVTSALDEQAIYTTAVASIREQRRDLAVHILAADTGRQRLVYQAGVSGLVAGSDADGLALDLDEHTDPLQPPDLILWVARHAEAALVNDRDKDERCPPSLLRMSDVRSELAVPMISGDQLLGVLDVQSAQPGAFTDDDCFLFQTLADSVAIAVRNASLYRSEWWHHRAADSLRESAMLLSPDAALGDVLDAVLFEVERALPCDLAVIYLLEEGDLYAAAVHGTDLTLSTDFALDVAPWLAEALRTDLPTARPSRPPPDPLTSTEGFPMDYSAIAAPLRVGSQQLGLLVVAHRQAARYGSESQTVLAAFAGHIAIAIENARTYQAAQEQAVVSTVMLQVAEATQSLATLDEVLQTVVRLAPMLVGMNRCAILLYDKPAEHFVPAAAYGLDIQQQRAFDQWMITPESLPVFADLRLNKAPVIIHDASTDARLSGSPAAALGFRSLALLPLLAQGQVLGAMLVDYRGPQTELDASGTLQDEQLAVIYAIALQTAVAIENAQLREAQQEEAYVSAALLQVAQTVASLSDLDDILGAAVRITPILVGVERCILFLWDEERAAFSPTHAYGIPREQELLLLGQSYAIGEFDLLDAVRDRDDLVVRIGDGSLEMGSSLPPVFADCLKRRSPDLCTLLAVPLSSSDGVLGVMVLEETGSPGGSPEKRREIISGIAHQAALAVQNERYQQERVGRERLERELQLAHNIQQTFIPRQLPQPAGWQLAAAWRAAREVAGDFYDLFELPDGCLGLLIADVADKGMPAALFMTLTRTLMRAATLENRTPAAALSQVNDLLVPDAHAGMFVTAFYAVLAPATGELRYANAGHNRPLLHRASTGEMLPLEKGGTALGVLAGAPLVEHALLMNPGDCLILYTDGVTEAFSASGQMYGQQGLRESVQSVSGSSAQTVLDEIDQAVRTFTGSAPPSDDLTILVLRRDCPSRVLTGVTE